MIVFDSSTLILLAKIDILPMVLNRYKGIIPEAVKKEVLYKDNIDAKLIGQQIRDGKLILNKSPDTKKIKLICKDFPLGRGEAAALIVAREKKCLFAVDDGLAIKVCKILNVKFVTAIHFLIGSGFDKKLTLAKLDLLQQYGRYSANIIKDAKERITGGYQ